MGTLCNMALDDEGIDVRALIEETLSDFEIIATEATGAILYSRDRTHPDLRRNLYAAVIATHAGLASLDYAKRTYTPETDVVAPIDANDQFLKATGYAREYMEAARRRLSKKGEPTVGAHASRVALQRLESGFRAADLLYRLGLNYEGDAVARQILEQIAWSLVAGGKEDITALSKVLARKSVGDLGKLLPPIGLLYGQLSKTTHAGLDQHRGAYVARVDANDLVVLTWSRRRESAKLLMQLADAWVVVWEHTQRTFLTKRVSYSSPSDLIPSDQRKFLKKAAFLVEAIDESAEDLG